LIDMNIRVLESSSTTNTVAIVEPQQNTYSMLAAGFYKFELEVR